MEMEQEMIHVIDVGKHIWSSTGQLLCSLSILTSNPYIEHVSEKITMELFMT